MINIVDKENQRKTNKNAPHLLDTYCHFSASKQYLFPMILSLNVKAVQTSNCKNKDLTPFYSKYYCAMVSKKTHASN